MPSYWTLVVCKSATAATNLAMAADLVWAQPNRKTNRRVYNKSGGFFEAERVHSAHWECTDCFFSLELGLGSSYSHFCVCWSPHHLQTAVGIEQRCQAAAGVIVLMAWLHLHRSEFSSVHCFQELHHFLRSFCPLCTSTMSLKSKQQLKLAWRSTGCRQRDDQPRIPAVIGKDGCSLALYSYFSMKIYKTAFNAFGCLMLL